MQSKVLYSFQLQDKSMMFHTTVLDSLRKHFMKMVRHCCPEQQRVSGRDRIVVSTSRCGRDNPGSNPGHGILAVFYFCAYIFQPNAYFISF